MLSHTLRSLLCTLSHVSFVSAESCNRQADNVLSLFGEWCPYSLLRAVQDVLGIEWFTGEKKVSKIVCDGQPGG